MQNFKVDTKQNERATQQLQIQVVEVVLSIHDSVMETGMWCSCTRSRAGAASKHRHTIEHGSSGLEPEGVHMVQ